MKRLPIFLSAILCLAASARAELRLPGFFGDHMVLQRDAPIPVWGWADPGLTVKVALGGEPVTATVGEDGRWRVELPAMPANATGLDFKVWAEGGKDIPLIELKDVLVGEVWLCSGQSNMEWTVAASLNSAEEIAAADFPAIRQMKIAHLTAPTPQQDVASVWQVCSPETAGSFTAAGYFMARELHRELGVPIGLLNSSWGGTRIEPWTPLEGFAKVPALVAIHDQVVLTLPTSEPYRAGLQRHMDEVAGWLAAAKESLETQRSAPATPVFPAALQPLTAHTAPTTLYNAMIQPLVGYGMRGAIWYQGESNHTEGMAYADKQQALVSGWRERWGLGDFPFYYVQIAPWHYGEEEATILARFWEAQSACLAIPNSGMVVTNDIGDVKDIHPKNKQEVGRRLALLALKHTYGRDGIVASGPVFRELVVEPGRLLVKFDEVAGGLTSRDGQPLTHFELIGETGEFVAAEVKIEGTDTVVLTAAGVKEPAAMRYAWHKLAEPNLANGAGLPASAFRAGEVPDYDFFSLKVPGADDYALVYDLDLKKLGPEIAYSEDRSGEIAGFDRVGYFLELTLSGGARQWVWSAMDAFTTEAKKLGVPTEKSGAVFQTAVANLSVLSNVDGLTTGEGLAGNLEFWPHNYGPENKAQVSGASGEVWDFGDSYIPPVAGYGSMQVHHPAAKQTVFAINHWDAGPGADLGIGNSSTDPRTRDWTFAGNAGSYETARLRVFVRKVK